MKKIISLVGMLAAVVLLFASCSKENSSSIIGTWRMEETVNMSYVDGKLTNTSINRPENGEEGFLEFSADGTVTTIVKTKSGEVQSMAGTYKLIDNILILSANKLGIGDKVEVENTTMTIDTLTSSTLIITEEHSYSSGGKNYTGIAKVTLKRV